MRNLFLAFMLALSGCHMPAYAADVRIDQLPSAGALVGTEKVPVIKVDGTLANTTTQALTDLTGLKIKGTWSSATPYILNDVVQLNGSSYVAIAPSLNQTPPNGTYWTVLAAKGDAGANGAGTGTVTSVASGTGLTGGPITSTGTLSLAAIANETLLGNVSGGSAAPIALNSTQILSILPSNSLALAKIATFANNTVLGNVSGGAAGPVALTGSQLAGILATNSVGVDRLATIATGTFLGNVSGSTTSVVAVSAANVAAALPAFTGDSGSGGAKGLVPAPGAGDTAGSKFLKADGTWAVPATSAAPFPKGYLWPRATLAHSSTTAVTIVPGAVRSSDDSANIVWGSNLTLTITATGANGLDVSGSRATNGTVHVFVISDGGSTVAAFGSSSLVPSLPGGYTKIRRVGSLRLDGSQNIRPFLARGDSVAYQTQVTESVALVGTTATNYAYSVPTGLLLDVSFRVILGTYSSTVYMRFYDPAMPDITINSSNANYTGEKPDTLTVGTNTSAQIRTRSDGSHTPTVYTLAYTDRRE